MIKKIHRLWFGPETMPDNYKDFGRLWQEMNPEWEMIDHGEDLLNQSWINQKVIDSILSDGKEHDADQVAKATQLADVISYELVFKYGGLYLNADIEPVKTLDYLFEMNPELSEYPMASKEDDHMIVNAVLWAPEEKNSFWRDVINGLSDRYYNQPTGSQMNETTGPHLVTDIYNKTKNDIVILSKNYFNPVHFSEVEIGEDAKFDELPIESIGVHHWGHRKNGRTQKVLNR